MGFTENAYPSLPLKLREQMPTQGVLSNEAEDELVTTILEDMLAMSPAPPKPSDLKSTIPGAWH